MPKCEFSETQFESYHARQYENLIITRLPGFFPTRTLEGQIGIDLALFGIHENFFFQYKVPYKLVSKTKRTKDFDGPPCYRIYITNIGSNQAKPQYETLKEWSNTFEHVYYVAPEFHSIRSFSQKYLSILGHSAMFNLRDMPDHNLPDIQNSNHYLYYDRGNEIAYMYSDDKKEFKKSNVIRRINEELFIDRQLVPFDDTLNKIRQTLINLFENQQFQEGMDRTRSEIIENVLNESYSLPRQYFNINFILKKYFDLNWIPVGKSMK